MAQTKALRGRIKSVQNTRKITRTMELVSTSKLKRAQDRVVTARPYAESLGAVISDLYTAELAEKFPLLRRPLAPGQGGPTRAAIILVTSNRGLAGGFNANLIKEARRRIEELEKAGYTVDLHAVGKKGIGYFKYVGFFAETIGVATGVAVPNLNVVLPIGISFFTFTQIAFLVDAARGEARIQTPPLSLVRHFFPASHRGPDLSSQGNHATVRAARDFQVRYFESNSRAHVVCNWLFEKGAAR